MAEGQVMAGESLVVRFANFVKLPHTVFALPFALVGATLASFTRGVTIGTLAWIVLGLRRTSSAIALFVIALGFAIGAMVLAGIERQPLAVLARSVQLRDAPHGLADEIGRAQELGVVELVEGRAAWRLIETRQGVRGWIPATAVVEVRPLDSRP